MRAASRVLTEGGLVELDPRDPAWLDAIATAPEAVAFHHPDWMSALVAAYGFRTAVLAHLDDGGRVAAGVPLARVLRPSGRTWVGLPFTDHCPPLARDDAALAGLAAGLAAWSREQGVPVEVRGWLPPEAGWTSVTVGTRHVLPLSGGVDAVWAGLRKTRRHEVRQARRGGLRLRFSHAPSDMGAFYRLHVATRRRLGVPVQPRRFVAAVWRQMVESGRGFAALVETAGGQAVAASVMLAWNGTLIEKFHASDARYWHAKPNQLGVWSTIERGCAEGFRALDFGRSDAGHATLQWYKSAWGARALPLTYSFAGGAAPGLAGRGRLDGLLRVAIRRGPTVVCRALGSLFYRYAA